MDTTAPQPPRPSPPERLPENESWVLLREAVVGRLAVMVDGAPDVFPVNHLVDHGTLVIRTAEGTKLAAAAGQPVAFEVDGYDPVSGDAWSVVAKGLASEPTELYDVLDAFLLPSITWHAGSKPHLLRLVPTSVTGRRFHRATEPAAAAPR